MLQTKENAKENPRQFRRICRVNKREIRLWQIHQAERGIWSEKMLMILVNTGGASGSV
jgi:hypothetical protein